MFPRGHAIAQGFSRCRRRIRRFQRSLRLAMRFSQSQRSTSTFPRNRPHTSTSPRCRRQWSVHPRYRHSRKSPRFSEPDQQPADRYQCSYPTRSSRAKGSRPRNLSSPRGGRSVWLITLHSLAHPQSVRLQRLSSLPLSMRHFPRLVLSPTIHVALHTFCPSHRFQPSGNSSFRSVHVLVTDLLPHCNHCDPSIRLYTFHTIPPQAQSENEPNTSASFILFQPFATPTMISWDTDVDSSCPTLFGWCRGFAEVSDSNRLDVSGGGGVGSQ